MNRVAVALLMVTVSGCGIGSSDSVDEIEPEELAGLSETSPRSATTVVTETTAPPAPTEETPPSAPPDSGTVEAPETSMTSAPTVATTVSTEDVGLYLVDGSKLVLVEIPIPAPVAALRHLRGLSEGPNPEDAKAGIRTAVPPGLVHRVRIRGERITVDLDEDVFNTVESPDQLQMVGQIVLTATGPMGLEEVTFTAGGKPVTVFRGDNSVSDPSEVFTRDDYAELLEDGPSSSGSAVGETSTP